MVDDDYVRDIKISQRKMWDKMETMSGDVSKIAANMVSRQEFNLRIDSLKRDTNDKIEQFRVDARSAIQPVHDNMISMDTLKKIGLAVGYIASAIAGALASHNLSL